MPDTKSCPFCAEEINAAALKCKHCGSMLDGAPVAASKKPNGKLRPLLWVCGIGGGLLVLGALGRHADEPDTRPEWLKHPAQAVPRRAIARSEPPGAPAIQAPADEVGFVGAVTQYVEPYKEAPNAIKKSTLRRERAAAVRAALRGSRAFFRWVGTLHKVGTNSDGDAHVEILIPAQPTGVVLKTWNNSLSDGGSHTLIKPSDPLYAAVGDMKQGDVVEVSGKLLADDRDFVKEASMSERGSMTEPEFIAHFENISKK